MVYTYSFESTTLNISHPDFGFYSAYGKGLGDITVSMANDITTHDVAADLSVIVSRSVKKNGTLQLNVSQASDFNRWLNKFVNKLEAESVDKFALATIVLKNNSTGETWELSGVSPQRKPDANYQSTAQTRNWVFMFADSNISQYGEI